MILVDPELATLGLHRVNFVRFILGVIRIMVACSPINHDGQVRFRDM